MTYALPKLIIAFIVTFVLLFPIRAMADTRAETLIETQAASALAILANPDLSQTQKTTQFNEKIEQLAAVNIIARFVLGPYAKTASPAELAEFTNVFHDYALSIYQSELGKYGKETLKVQKSVDRKPGDSIVFTQLSGGALKAPSLVKWRVLNINGEAHVVDIEVGGIWLTQHQRAEITAIIDKNNGAISAAIDSLCAKSHKCGDAKRLAKS